MCIRAHLYCELHGYWAYKSRCERYDEPEVEENCPDFDEFIILSDGSYYKGDFPVPEGKSIMEAFCRKHCYDLHLNLNSKGDNINFAQHWKKRAYLPLLAKVNEQYSRLYSENFEDLVHRDDKWVLSFGEIIRLMNFGKFSVMEARDKDGRPTQRAVASSSSTTFADHSGWQQSAIKGFNAAPRKQDATPKPQMAPKYWDLPVPNRHASAPLTPPQVEKPPPMLPSYQKSSIPDRYASEPWAQAQMPPQKPESPQKVPQKQIVSQQQSFPQQQIRQQQVFPRLQMRPKKQVTPQQPTSPQKPVSPQMQTYPVGKHASNTPKIVPGPRSSPNKGQGSKKPNAPFPKNSKASKDLKEAMDRRGM